MAAYISSASTPKINWAARDMSLEYLNFEDMCELMFYGPMMDCLNNEEAKFAHMSLWGGSKAIELFSNSSLSMHKTSANLLHVLKDYCCKDTSVESCEEHFTSHEINEKQQNDSDLFCSMNTLMNYHVIKEHLMTRLFSILARQTRINQILLISVQIILLIT